MKPNATMPSSPKQKPPRKAPAIPTTMLPVAPKPLPFVMTPASQPAIAADEHEGDEVRERHPFLARA